MTFEFRFLCAHGDHRLVADDNHFTGRSVAGQGFHEVIGKIDADMLAGGFLQSGGNFAVVALRVIFDARAGKFLCQRIHHDQPERCRFVFRRAAKHRLSQQQSKRERYQSIAIHEPSDSAVRCRLTL